MRKLLIQVTAGGVAAIALGALACARNTAPLPPSPTQAMTPAAVDGSQQLPGIRGELDQLTLTGRGDVAA